jgi:transposase-like protein
MELAKRYRNFTPEFREEIARLVVVEGRSIAEVAREYGLRADAQIRCV